MRKVTAKAPVNIALIKYWGKSDKEKVTPYNPSLSLTLDNLYTITSIEESIDGFSFILNNELQSKKEADKVYEFLLQFASSDEVNTVKVISENFLPTAAGLASSASGFAALATAANSYFLKNFDINNLAAITRRGSGSACRSLFSGFVAWELDGSVYELESKYNDFVMISVILDKFKKSIPSREAMEITVQTSLFYPKWIEQVKSDFIEMKEALKIADLKKIGELTEQSARLMHATMLSSNPPIMYMTHESMDVWRIVSDLRDEDVYAYATMDAGVNVKILTTESDYQKVLSRLTEEGFINKSLKNFNISRIGKKAELINEN